MYVINYIAVFFNTRVTFDLVKRNYYILFTNHRILFDFLKRNNNILFSSTFVFLLVDIYI